MADPFVAEIRLFPYNFAPSGWAFCDGQLMAISQNTALFSLLGTMYGGDGRSTFALPNLMGMTPIHAGQSTTGTIYDQGETAGIDFLTLIQSELPAHTHTMQAGAAPGNLADPTGAELTRSAGAFLYGVAPASPAVNMSPTMVATSGGGQPHNNLMPYLVLNYCIALQGVFPQRS